MRYWWTLELIFLKLNEGQKVAFLKTKSNIFLNFGCAFFVTLILSGSLFPRIKNCFFSMVIFKHYHTWRKLNYNRKTGTYHILCRENQTTIWRGLVLVLNYLLLILRLTNPHFFVISMTFFEKMVDQEKCFKDYILLR